MGTFVFIYCVYDTQYGTAYMRDAVRVLGACAHICKQKNKNMYNFEKNNYFIEFFALRCYVMVHKADG